MSKVFDIDSVIENLNKVTSSSQIKLNPKNNVINFSTEGRGGSTSFFTIEFGPTLKSFEDILAHLSEIEMHTSWSQDNLRPSFSSILTDPFALTLASTQTKPLFHMLAKLISATNELPYIDGQISWEKSHIESVIKFLKRYTCKDTATINDPDRVTGGKNLLLYGAPGTGKSYSIKEMVNNDYTIRTVFHADTQNSDFCGSLKPHMNKNVVSYEFRPGPFTKSLVNAINDHTNHHFLVIEEINRAPAAAVFGELFQLLDRDNSTGVSSYDIDLSDPDMIAYIEHYTSTHLHDGKIRLPSNLSLLATMNSSDQAVMPLDTAFKRRWRFRYIPLDFTKCTKGTLRFADQESILKEIEWKQFALSINKILSTLEINEDKQLGPYFLDTSELSTAEFATESLTGKLFMYLWDDVLRHGSRDELFTNKAKTYGKLVSLYKQSKPVFSKKFYEMISDDHKEITVPISSDFSDTDDAKAI